MGAEPHKKIEIATQQLEAAVRLFFYGGEYVAALTLAGAAEEIFGRILQALGKEPALHSYARTFSYLMDVVENKQIDQGLLRKQANVARNAAKHFNSFDELTVVFDARDEAIQMISRAITNYRSLHLPDSNEIQRFEKFYDEQL